MRRHSCCALEEWLDDQRATRVRRTRNRITFGGGLFRLVSGWNPLVAIGSGEIDVTRTVRGVGLRYTLRFSQMLVTVSALVGFFLGPPILASGMTALEKAMWLTAMWGWLVGGNVVITWYRFPKLLRASVVRSLDCTGGE